MEPPAASFSSPDPTPQQDHSPSPAKRSAWKHPAPNGVGDAPAPGPAAVMDANHWPALSDAAKNNTKLTPTPAPAPDSTSSSSSSSPSPVAASSAMTNSSNSHKHASGTHHARHHKPARRAAAAGDHSPRDHPDRTAAAAAWDHGAGATGGRGAQRNHNNAGGRRGNGTTASATGVSHHSAAAGGGGGFGGRRRGGYEPFYRGPPPMGGMGPYMRGAPPPPPPMTPFMAPPPPPVSPMRPFAGPMVFHDMQSPVSPVSPIYFYGPPPPPEALRGLPLAPPMVGPPAYPYFQAPSEPQPEPEPEPDVEGEERAKLLYQIEFYFSKENLCSDVYLRQKMDGQGWVDISLIAGFKKVQELTKDLQYIKQTVRSSSILEMQDDKIRKQNDWEKWVIRHESNPDIPSSSASVPRPNVNNLTAHLGGMGLHESASSSSTMEQNHHDVIQNGSTSGNDEAPVVDGNSSHQ